MALNLIQKIIQAHLISGTLEPGREIGLKIDQTLTQDATGTMAYLEFEAIGLPRVKTELSVSYVDHNTLQTGFENADDHRFLQTAAAKYGVYFSRPGNGICHQVHLERFGKPGKTLLGSDSHTPTGGGLGMLAIGAGGLDVALAMAGEPFYLTMPRVVNVYLTGELSPWVSAKEIILELLRLLTVKGGVGKVFEYSGPGVKGLSIPERATITNMGAELGATSSVFPSDETTRKFLAAQEREEDFIKISADEGATYDETIKIDLSTLVPLVAKPHSPDNVVPVTEVEKVKVDQVFIGSCTNSSLTDMLKVAAILRGKVVHPDVSLCIAPGSKQVLQMLAANGALADLVAAGARILESACGPCVGVGQAPASQAVSLRTSNRNFEARSGTADAEIYLASAETCAASALTGHITDARTLGAAVQLNLPDKFTVDDRMIIPPPQDGSAVEIVRGPNIRPLPQFNELPASLSGEAVIKVGDNITTDHIMPAGAKILPFRSNIPEISKHVFAPVDKEFYSRATAKGGGFIIGGHNYGQGSSREHAALAPKHLGIKAVIVKSFARIHLQNLINFGILPLTFAEEKDYDGIASGDTLEIQNLLQDIETNSIQVYNRTKNQQYAVKHSLSVRQLEMLKAGGLLNFVGINKSTLAR
ncbi:MAG: aconitate hydratase [Clostridia bacterium]|jgi:aconitate hydratase|nr:aconitate hydratase [Clostridia bacterium]